MRRSWLLVLGVGLMACNGEETVFDTAEMPPGGAMRLQPYEELILQRWHDTGAPCD